MADNKRSSQSSDLLRALLWAALAFFAWQMISVQIWPPQPVEPPSAPDFGDSTAEGPFPAIERTPSDSTESPSGEAGVDTVRVVSADARTLIIGDTTGAQASPFRMAAVLTTVGASLVSVDLSDYAELPDEDSPRYRLLDEVFEKDQAFNSFTTEHVYLRELDIQVTLGNVAWSVESQSTNHVVFSTEIIRGQTPLIRLRKTFDLLEQPSDRMRSDLGITLDLTNLSDQPQTVTVTSHGPVGLRQEDLRFNDRTVFVAIDNEGSKQVSGGLATIVKNEAIVYKPAGDGVTFAWTASGNKYFVAFDTPVPPDGRNTVDWIDEVSHLHLGGDPAATSDVTFRTRLKPILLQPGETRSILNECYLGPKSREAFNEVAAYREQEYVRQIDASYSIGACSFMTFKSLTRFMVWLLNVLQAVVINYGIAIIILVLIVRTLLHPLTKKGQVNMMRMQERMGALAPKMEDIKKRYANDKTRLNQETMKLYQQEGINPATQFLSSCLPMMLQMPIWIALYTSLNFNIDMRHQPFVWWIRDLTAPDAFLQFEARTIPLLSALTGPITSLNLLPILVSLSMFLQQKLMPKPTPPSGRSSEQATQAEQMQKMMPYMTLMFGLFFYNMPSGLNLYIMASSTFGALEQWRIRKHIAELKEKGDVLKTASKKKAAAKGGPSFFQRLQKAAAEAQKVKSQHGKKKRKH